MILSDFLKAHGIELTPPNDNPPTLADGVRMLLSLMSRRHTRGKSIWLDKTLLESEWPRSIKDSCETAIEQATQAGYVQGGPVSYSLTELGKRAAH